MKIKPENPPAFPSCNEITIGNISTNGHAGLSLRDYFAATAPITYSDAKDACEHENGFVSYGKIYEWLAAMKFAYADAMLKERSK